MTTLDTDRQQLLMKLLLERGNAAQGPKIAPVPPGTAVPLNSAQARMWFFCRQYPSSTEYTVPELRIFDGALDSDTLTAAVAKLMSRHDALRLQMFERDGVPMQQDCGRIEPPVSWHDLRHLTPQDATDRALELSNRAAQRAFPIDEPYLFEIIGFGLPGDRTMLAINFHHMVVDGLSSLRATTELDALLRGQPLGPPPAVGFLDWVAWEAEHSDEATLERELAYWTDKLAGDLPVLDLPRDRPRPAESSRTGHIVPVEVRPPLLARLQRLAEEEGVTLYVAVMAAYKLFLARMTRQHDIIVGAPLAGRDHAVTEGVIGCFVKSVPLRTSLAGDPTFREIVRRERETMLGAYDNQTVPFDRVVAKLGLPRLPGVTPVFQTMVNLLSAEESDAGANNPAAEASEGGLGLELDTNSTQRDLSLSLSVDPVEGGLRGVFIYSADIFDRPTVQRFATVFQDVVAAAVEQPDAPAFALPLLVPAERERILHGLNPYQRPDTRYQTAAQPLEEQARRTPEAVALHGEQGPVSYAALNAQANQLAWYLRHAGVRPGQTVALCASRGTGQVVALYAAAKLGAAYLLLDPRLADDQLTWRLDDAAPAVVIAARAEAPRVPAGPWQLVRAAEPAPWADGPTDDVPVEGNGYAQLPLYYTPGATGRPALAASSVAAALARLDWLQRTHPVGPGDAVLATTTASAPATVEEILWPLHHGATLVVGPPGDASSDAARMLDLIDAHDVTTVFTTPSLLRSLLWASAPGQGRTLRRVLCAGEPVSAGLRDRWQAQFPGELVTGYGTAETGRITDVMVAAGPSASVSAGRPAPHVALYVLDDALAPTPVGVPGELYVGGEAGLAAGYHRAPGLTAERFLADPFGRPGTRMLRTGELGRYRDDGTLEYLGRIDRQVVRHGLRVELTEVEAAFTDQEGVARAVVTGIPERDGELAAFVVPGPGWELSAADLADDAARRLPPYLMPASVTLVGEIPETPDGVTDAAALLALADYDDEAELPVEPATPLEAQLAGIYCRLLRCAQVSVTESFFDLGGHSLLVFKLIEECTSELGLRPTVQDVFTGPSVRELAATLEAMQAAPGDEDTLVCLAENAGAPVLVFVHAASGSVLPFFEVAERLGGEFAVYALQARPDDPPGSIEEIAARYVDVVDEVRGVAPVVLAGWSMGGCVALEMARRWLGRDERVAATLLLDTWAPPSFMSDAADAAQARASILALDVLRLEGADAFPEAVAELSEMVERHRAAFLAYRPEFYPGEVEILRATDPLPADAPAFPAGYLDGTRGWEGYAAEVSAAEVSGSHLSLFDQDHADDLAAAISAAIARRLRYEEI